MMNRAESESSDHDPSGSGESIQCACGHVIPIGDEDCEIDAYCPSCGKAVSLQAGESVAPSQTIESSAEIETSRDGHSQNLEISTTKHEQSDVKVFGTGNDDCSEDEIVSHIQCLCGESVPVRLADFDANVYCPSCSAELPVSKQLTRFRATEAVEDNDESDHSIPASELTSPQTRSGWNLVSLVSIPLMIFIVGLGLNWRDRNQIGGTIRQTFLGDGGPTGSSVAVPFDLKAVTTQAIEGLRLYPDTFAALTLAANWQREFTDANLNDGDRRLSLVSEVIADLLTHGTDDLRTQINTLLQSDDLAAAIQTGHHWRQTLLTLEESDESLLLVDLEAVLLCLDERVNPITLEAIEQLRQSNDLEQSLVQARLWESTLIARSTPSIDARMTRLKEIIFEIANEIAPLADAASQTESDCEALLEQFTEQLSANELESAKLTAEQAHALLDTFPEDLARFRKRLALLERRLDRLQQSEKAVSELMQELDRVRALSLEQRVTKALQTEAKVRFIALSTPMNSVSASQLRKKIQELAPVLRRVTGMRAANEAISLNAVGDLRSRNHEVRRALEQLSEFNHSEVGESLQRLEPWREDALMQTGESLQDVADSNLAQRIVRRDRVESMFRLYAEGKVSELYTAAIDVIDSEVTDRDDSDGVEQSLMECLLHALERQTAAELHEIDPQDEDQRERVVQSAFERLRSLSRWNHLSHWQTVHELLRSFDYSETRE